MRMSAVDCPRSGHVILTITSDINGREFATTHHIPLSIVRLRRDLAMEMRDDAIRDHLHRVQHAKAEQFGTTHAGP